MIKSVNEAEAWMRVTWLPVRTVGIGLRRLGAERGFEIAVITSVTKGVGSIDCPF